MNENVQVCFHTNVPAPYRRHQFELISLKFPNSVIYLTRRQASYRPWSNDTSGWKANIRAVTQGQLIKDLFLQRWGSVHVCGAGMDSLYWKMLRLSGLIGHSIVIDWDDAYTSEDIEAYANMKKKSSFLRRFLTWLTFKARKGVFTPGCHGATMARLKGFRNDQIVNSYFSHDVTKYVSYDMQFHEEMRRSVREAHKINPEKVVLLNISRFLDWKRLDDLAEALLILERKHQDEAKRCELILIGDGEYKNHLPLLGQLKVIRVHIVKPMPPDEVLKYYCASDLFVFPSEGDIWGLVVNEALSMGLPVICTDSIGASELIDDGKNGYKVPRRSPEAIADKVLLLLDDERRQQFAAAAKCIKDTWNTEMGIAALEKFLSMVR